MIDNSIYWIGERQRRALHDNTFKIDSNDKIIIKQIDENTLHIYDTGTGVLPEYQHTLFHPLISGRDKGRGMGLYIIKNFLESFDSEIILLPDLNKYGNKYIFAIHLKYEHSDEDNENE